MNVYVVRDAGVNNGDTLDAIFVDVNNKMDDVNYAAEADTDANVKTVDTATFTLTVPTASAAEGDDVTVTVTPTGTVAAATSIVVKCNETGKTQTISFAAGATEAKSVTFTQEAYVTSYAIVDAD